MIRPDDFLDRAVAAAQADAKRARWLAALAPVAARHRAMPGGLLGAAEIEIDDAGLVAEVEPGAGVACVAMGVWTHAWPEMPAGAAIGDHWPGDFAPRLIDVVCWDPRDPFRWWLAAGPAAASDPVWLGASAVRAARDEGQPLMLHATPLHWLRAGAAGAVLLDGGGGVLREQLDGIAEIAVATEAMAAALKTELRKLPPRPPKPAVRVQADVSRPAA